MKASSLFVKLKCYWHANETDAGKEERIQIYIQNIEIYTWRETITEHTVICFTEYLPDLIST